MMINEPYINNKHPSENYRNNSFYKLQSLYFWLLTSYKKLSMSLILKFIKVNELVVESSN